MKTLTQNMNEIRMLRVAKENGIRFVGDILLESEMLSEDGEKIICKNCGKAKYKRQRSIFLRREYWNNCLDDGQGCDCDRASRAERIRQEEIARFKAAYASEPFMKVAKGYLSSCQFTDDYYKSLPEHILAPLRTVWKYCNDFQEKRTHGMYIHSSGPGLCKTSMMACARNMFLDNGVPCIMTNVVGIMDAFFTDRDAFNSFRKVDVLIIDDIGIQDPSESWATDMGRVNSALYELLNERMLIEDNPTLFTSNYSIEELLERGLKPQTVDRIRGVAGKTVLSISGPSQR